MGEDFQMLSAQEIEDLFTPDTEEKAEDTATDNQSTEDKPEETTEDNSAEVDVDTLFEDSPESVGREENKRDGQGASTQEVSTSPAFYSSIVRALVKDGIFPDLKDEDIDNVKTAEDFETLFNKRIEAGLDVAQRRINEALTYGVPKDAIQYYETMLKELNSVSEESLTEESDNAVALRRNLLLIDFKDKGFSEERAIKTVKQSFDAGSDIEDAKDALESLRTRYKEAYDALRNEAKNKALKHQEEEQKAAEDLVKNIRDNKDYFKGLELDQATRTKLLDNLGKKVYKDPTTGQRYTAVQKYFRENPRDFNTYVTLFFTLTDGFTNLAGAFKPQVKKEMNKGIKELEKVLRNSKTPDGSLSFVGLNDGNSKVSNWDFDV